MITTIEIDFYERQVGEAVFHHVNIYAINGEATDIATDFQAWHERLRLANHFLAIGDLRAAARLPTNGNGSASGPVQPAPIVNRKHPVFGGVDDDQLAADPHHD